jgi:hypothetical protein
MSKQTPEQDREQMIDEWMRSNDAFKSLARQYGKGGKKALLVDQPEDAQAMQPVKVAQGVELDAKQEALLDWLGSNEAFKRLAKQYGRTFPHPKPSR